MLFTSTSNEENYQQSLQLENADLQYYPQFLNAENADSCFKTLLSDLDWKSFPIKMFGKMVMQPRLVAWHGMPNVPIRYSGVTLEPAPFTTTLLAIKAELENTLGISFNGVLCNLYRDENDSMGWHSDDEKYLGKCPIIASVSLGEVRKFQLKSKTAALVKANLLLEHGSLLVMKGETQTYFKHQLPKMTKPCGPRINLTFRQIIPHLV